MQLSINWSNAAPGYSIGFYLYENSLQDDPFEGVPFSPTRGGPSGIGASFSSFEHWADRQGVVEFINDGSMLLDSIEIELATSQHLYRENFTLVPIPSSIILFLSSLRFMLYPIFTSEVKHK